VVRADNFFFRKKIVPRATRQIYGRFHDTLNILKKGKYRLVVSKAKFKDGKVPNRKR